MNSLYLIENYGAVMDGVTDDTAAVQKAINACNENGGGTVVVPAGKVVRIGTIELKSFVELHVERGARLWLSDNVEDFDKNNYTTRARAGIYACDAENIAVTGAGVIDGNGRAFVTEKLPDIHKTIKNRPYVMIIRRCKNFTMRDFTIEDASVWTIDLSGCYNGTIHNIKILNDMNMPNSDGIDIDRCKFIRISDCHLECGDDCIVLKSHKYIEKEGSCENITVTNCTMISKSFAINLGCEVDTPIRNCVFSNCIIKDSHRGIGIHLSEHSNIENVIFSDFYVETRFYPDCWWGAAEPIYVVSIPWTEQDTVGYVRNIMFKNIYCHSENGVIVHGHPTAEIDGIVFSDVHVTLDKFGPCKGGRYDLRPCPGDENGFDDGVFEHEASGFYVKHAQNVRLSNCSVRFGENKADYFGEALDIKDDADVKITDFFEG